MPPSPNQNDPYIEQLDERLKDIPLHSPSPDFVDRVMQSIAELRSTSVEQHAHQTYIQSVKNQWIHALVATTATLIFVFSGAYQSIVSGKAIEFGIVLQDKTGEAVSIGAAWIFSLTEQLSGWL